LAAGARDAQNDESVMNGLVGQLGRNADGEILVPGRVPGCYLGLRLDWADDAQAAGVLVVAPPRCCIRSCRGRTAPCCTSW
jgi:hypothetical protein